MDLFIEVDLAASGKRLDQLLKDSLPGLSRGRIQKAIRSGACSVDGQPVLDSDYRLKYGQKLSFSLPEEKTALKPEDGELRIIWHDQDLAVCDKDPYLTVHPCPSCPENTLAQRLLSRFPQLAAMGGERPGIVHRLDKDTSGLLLVALTEEARLKLTEAFAAREIKKEYLALVHGCPPLQGQCSLSIGRHPEIRAKMAIVPENKGGKSALTEWRRLWHSPVGDFSLLALRIHTGRTHQIRVHMSHLGYPLLGDRLYAPASIRDLAPRQMLHAAKVDLVHPVSQKPLSFSSPLPDDFLETIVRNAEQPIQVVVTGNPACGKSSFTRELSRRGLPVIDADAIISELYSGPGPVSDWLSMRGFTDVLASNRAVLKAELMNLFTTRPEIRKEFENFVHALVHDRIKDFWEQKPQALAAVAEIPLFFEAAWRKKDESCLCVGIHCDQKIRFNRLRTERNWSDEKINAIESWQMPEKEKMALCDLVYDNMTSREELAEAADNLINHLKSLRESGRQKLLADIRALNPKADPATA